MMSCGGRRATRASFRFCRTRLTPEPMFMAAAPPPPSAAAPNLTDYRDAASLLIDQLKEIYIDAELDLVETANWLAKLMRAHFVLAQSVAGAGIEDPDQIFYENYGCKSNRNYTHYCDPEI